VKAAKQLAGSAPRNSSAEIAAADNDGPATAEQTALSDSDWGSDEEEEEGAPQETGATAEEQQQEDCPLLAMSKAHPHSFLICAVHAASYTQLCLPSGV
jgi:hypothetical protein